MTQYSDIDHAAEAANARVETPAQRRHRRRSVFWPAEIASKPFVRCMIINISIAGAKMTVSKPVSVDEVLVVRSRRFTAKARVAWAEPTVIGLEFLEVNERLMKALDAP